MASCFSPSPERQALNSSGFESAFGGGPAARGHTHDYRRSSGSTAGGIKTTTFALAILCLRSAFQNQESIQCYKRRIPYDIPRNAIAILALYITDADGHVPHYLAG